MPKKKVNLFSCTDMLHGVITVMPSWLFCYEWVWSFQKVFLWSKKRKDKLYNRVTFWFSSLADRHVVMTLWLLFVTVYESQETHLKSSCSQQCKCSNAFHSEVNKVKPIRDGEFTVIILPLGVATIIILIISFTFVNYFTCVFPCH